jgi:hypothetical protein
VLATKAYIQGNERCIDDRGHNVLVFAGTVRIACVLRSEKSSSERSSSRDHVDTVVFFSFLVPFASLYIPVSSLPQRRLVFDNKKLRYKTKRPTCSNPIPSRFSLSFSSYSLCRLLSITGTPRTPILYKTTQCLQAVHTAHVHKLGILRYRYTHIQTRNRIQSFPSLLRALFLSRRSSGGPAVHTVSADLLAFTLFSSFLISLPSPLSGRHNHPRSNYLRYSTLENESGNLKDNAHIER